MPRTTVNITGYTVDDNVNSSDDLFNLAMGSIFALLGADVLSDDAIGGPGVVRVRGTATIDDSLLLSGAALFVDVNGVTQNDAVVDLGLSAEDAVTARNLGGATWTLLNGAGITSAGASEFVNRGLLHEAAGDSTIDANFYDRGGEIEIDGTLNFASPGDVDRFVDDTIAGTGAFVVDDFAVLAGSTVSTSTTDLWNARIVGEVTISSPNVGIYNIVNLAAGSDLTLTNATANLNAFDISSNEIIGAGTIDLEGNDNVYSYENFNLIGAVTFVNSGDSTFDGSIARTVTGFELYANSWAGDQIVVENGAGATWVEQGSNGFFVNLGGGMASFDNYGVFIDQTYLGARFDMSVVNDGVFEGPASKSPPGIGAGLEFDDSVTGTGTIEIGVDNVTAYALIGGGQTLEFVPVQMAGASPTLTLDDVQQFSGLVAGFDQGGVTNDQLLLNTSTWTYQDFVANAGGTGGSLEFSDGAAETAVNLTGSYTPSGFHAAVNGATTTITYSGFMGT
jgi:hypothetical protein